MNTEDSPVKRVETAIGIAGGLIGLAAYLYLLGGLVTWLRFSAARLPTDDTIRAIDSKRLLAVGIKAFLFEVILLGSLLGITWLIWNSHTDVGDSQKKKAEEGWTAWILVLQATVAGLLVGAIVARFDGSTPPESFTVGFLFGLLWVVAAPLVLRRLQGRGKTKKYVKTGLTMIAAGLAVYLLVMPLGIAILALLLFLHLSHLMARLPTKRDPARLIPAVLVLGAGLSLIVGAYLATPPVSLDRATVILSDGNAITGGYAGQSSEGVFLATCVPNRKNPMVSRVSQLKVISASEVERVVLGGPRFVLDYGKNPSLLDLGLYLLDPDSLEQRFRTVSIDYREDQLVCGRQHFFQLTGRRLSARGYEQRARVQGAGKLIVSGTEVEREKVETDQAGDIAVPIVLDSAASEARRCRGPFETKIRIWFRLNNGEVEERRLMVSPPVEPAGLRWEGCGSGGTEAREVSGGTSPNSRPNAR